MPIKNTYTTKYTVFFSIGLGTTTGRHRGYTDYKKARKEARAMALANCPVGSSGFWQVFRGDGLGGQLVAQGRV